MVRATPVAKKAALRALREGEPPLFPLLAAAGQVHEDTLRHIAIRENWDKVDYTSRPALQARSVMNAVARGVDLLGADGLGGELAEDGADGEAACEAAGAADTPDLAEDGGEADPVAMLGRASQFFARQLGRIIAEADRRGGRLDKGQIDALAAMARVAERLEMLAREQGLERQRKNDDELAAIQQELVDCLVGHAQAEAERLAGEFLAPGPAGGAGRRLAGEGEA